MIKFGGVLAIVILLTTNAFAQKINVKIIAKNDADEMLQNATAQFLNSTDSSIVTVKALKNNIPFSLIANKSYLLKITAIGYAPYFKLCTIFNNDTTINVALKTFSKKLDAVVVTTTKPLIKQEDDKTIIDAEPLAQSSTNAVEVLEKTPGAIVDQDGNVYLNSATPATILINGRQLQLSPADIASLLKSIPASSISKIETISNPSAKFDAASSGGVVNIVLKKGAKLGMNGSVDVSYFQGLYATKTTGFNINNSKDKLNTYLSYSYTDRTFFQYLDSERPYFNTLFVQDFFQKFNAKTHFTGGGFSYDATKKWNLNFDTKFSATNNRNNLNNDIFIFRRDNRNNKIGQNLSKVNNDADTYFWGNTFTTKYKIDSLGSDWSNSVEYSYFNTTATQLYNNFSFIPTNTLLIGDGTIQNQKNIFVYKSDLVLKTKTKYTIETGLKFNYAASNNKALFFADTTGGQKYLNTFQTNTLKIPKPLLRPIFK